MKDIVNKALNEHYEDMANDFIHSVGGSWYQKLKCLMEGLEIENIDLFLSEGKSGDYRRLGEVMTQRIKELKK